MIDNAYAVIMAGGKGERFWPMSTSQRPKQVLSLIGGKSLLAQALDRIEELIPPERVLVITSEDLVDATCAAAPSLPRENVVGEPFGRDTAAVCALAGAMVQAKDPDGICCILTADHIIQDGELFHTTLSDAIRMASTDDVLITIGIAPSSPSTGYGYIEAGDMILHDGEVEFRKVKRFVEKPDAETAVKYTESGEYLWNAGMFIWSVNSILSAVDSYCPQLKQMVANIRPALWTQGFDDRLREEYGKLDKISIDYAIMEKADNIVTATGAFRWDDVGTWTALDNHFDHDETGNVLLGSCEQLDSENNIVLAGDRLTALIGVKDLVVVQAEGATLICAKECAQDVKKMVSLLTERGKYDELL